MISQEIETLCVGLAELQAYARIETGEEEALLAGLLRTASEMCEGFLNQALVSRTFEVVVRAGDSWTMLPVQPVRAISSIRRSDATVALTLSSYRTDIDFDGRGLVAGLPSGETFVVTGTAGMAADRNGVPEPIRQEILRLAAFMFANRDAQAGDFPNAVTSLWRPYRKAGLFR